MLKKRITCKCGRYIYLRLPNGKTFEGATNKTHAHCFPCKLEWHWNAGRIYSHPYYNFSVRKLVKKKEVQIVFDSKVKKVKEKPVFAPSFSFMDIAKVIK